MKTLMLALLVMVLSCSKDAVEPAQPFDAKNRFDGSITSTTGETKLFSAVGSSVIFGCGLGVGSFITAYQSESMLDLIFIGGTNCVSGPGTYAFAYQYHPDYKSNVSPVYYSWWNYRRGVITYTVVKGKYYEGYFEDVSKVSQTATDSILVKGTFSGYSKW